jgi:hypothetical protein
VCTLTHEGLLFVAEEVGGLEVLRDEEDATCGVEDGDDPFNNI